MTKPTSLIINSPYEVPLQHWQQARDGSLTLTPERRPAGYEIFDARHNTRRTETLDLVNSIRGRRQQLGTIFCQPVGNEQASDGLR